MTDDSQDANASLPRKIVGTVAGLATIGVIVASILSPEIEVSNTRLFQLLFITGVTLGIDRFVEARFGGLSTAVKTAFWTGVEAYSATKKQDREGGDNG